MDDWLPRRVTGRTIEVALLAALVLAGAVFILGTSRDLWFVGDFWGLVRAEPGGLPILLEPHAGHPSLPQVLGAMFIAAVTGLGDAWPWSMVPRVLAWGGFLVVLWWVVRRRGADPRIALAAVAVLTAFGSTAWMAGWLPGGPVAVAAVLSAAVVVADVEDPTHPQVVRVAALLVLAAASSTTGLLGAASVCVVALVSGRGRRWWPAAATLVTLYGAWRLAVDATTPGPSMTAEVVLGAPGIALGIARAGYARLLTVPAAAGGVAGLLVAGLLLWAAARRRLDAYDAIILLWGALYLGAAISVRIAAGQASVLAIRYGYVIVLLTLALVLPRLRLPDGRVATTVVALVAVVLGVRNAQELGRGIDFWEARSVASRAVVESAAALVADGEPFVAAASIDAPRAGMLTTDQVVDLVEGGWSPPRASEEAIEQARGDLRVRLRPSSVGDGVRCVAVSATGTAAPATSFLLRAGGPTVIRTSDESGLGIQMVERSGVWRVRLAAGTAVTLESEAAGTEVCT